jgi:hypothetical protein
MTFLKGSKGTVTLTPCDSTNRFELRLTRCGPVYTESTNN